MTSISKSIQRNEMFLFQSYINLLSENHIKQVPTLSQEVSKPGNLVTVPLSYLVFVSFFSSISRNTEDHTKRMINVRH